MGLALNLEKSQQTLTLNLQKAGIITPPHVQINFILDVSGSFDDEHRSGMTSDIITRLVPWAATFDPDKKMDVFTFSSGAGSAHKVGSVSEANYQDYVKNYIINKVPGYGHGTDYSYVLEESLKESGWIGGKKKGFLGGLFGKKSEAVKQKTLNIFVTDGENSDKSRTIQVLEESEERGDGVYTLFIGVSSDSGQEFPFIKQLGQRFGNTGFEKVANLKKFIEMDDQALYELLLNGSDKKGELLNWLKG